MIRRLTVVLFVCLFAWAPIALAGESDPPPADPLAEPARTVVEDCQDDGDLDGDYTRAQLDKAEFQAIHYPALNHPDQGNPGYEKPWNDCGPMVEEALIRALGDTTVPLTDCYMDSRLEGLYSAAVLDQARTELPQEWSEVSSCKPILRDAADEAASTSSASVASAGIRAARSPRWAKRAVLRAGHRVAHRAVKLRAIRRHGRHSFYGQVRWPRSKRGACYAEAVVVNPRHGRVKARPKGRHCTGR
jgi:hypothetical protein